MNQTKNKSNLESLKKSLSEVEKESKVIKKKMDEVEKEERVSNPECR